MMDIVTIVGLIAVLTLGLAGLLATAAAEAPPQMLPVPLPLEVAVSLQSHNDRSSFDLSPDGEWLAHTVNRAETLSKDRGSFFPSGKPSSEGNARMQALLSNTKTDQVVRLGGARGSSWAPVWSPDGKRVAFYADDEGQAGLWLWERATGKAERFPGVIVRPFFGFEVVRWSRDGQRLLCKVLPEGMTVSEANALPEETRQKPAQGPDDPSVLVHVAQATKEHSAPPGDVPGPEMDVWTNRSMADLAILDLRTGEAVRIAERIKPLWYAFSPNKETVAYTHLKGLEPNTQQLIYDLRVHDLASGHSRTLAENMRLDYGIEVNWSPNGRWLAYLGNKGEVVLVSVANGTVKTLDAEQSQTLDSGDYRAPLFHPSEDVVYGIGKDGKLWRIDVESGSRLVVGDIPGHRITALISRPDLPTLWTTDGGRKAWVLTREQDGSKAGIFSVDLTTGQSRAMVEESMTYWGTFNLDASDVTGEIAYVASDQQHPEDAWVLSTTTGRTRQVSHLNPDLERYELGTARLIEWYGVDGQKLRGALLLPPGYQEGQRVPLVVWVYGGVNGSDAVNQFGFWGGGTFNMHVLATRGYAVLFPDAPLNQGTPMKDLVHTVIPGVNAAIEQGYADPDRLAVMGQSYGAWCSLALIAQTTRFKAAVLTAAVNHPDLVSAYLAMDPDGDAPNTGYYEHGQGNMGGTPWEHRDRYLDNSPIFLFDRIETPVLIGQGDKDSSLSASDAVFVALRRLGKEVEYRIYENEGHVITRKPNVLDFWKRRLEFLDKHLDVTRDAEGRMIFSGERTQSRAGR
jgi:dipeptidyl aminopeptidase/acylaminoacyl peptidase